MFRELVDSLCNNFISHDAMNIECDDFEYLEGAVEVALKTLGMNEWDYEIEHQFGDLYTIYRGQRPMEDADEVVD
jgi:hypothetical protein